MRYDFLATINARTTRHIPAYFLFFISPLLPPACPSDDAIRHYHLVRALLTGFYEPRSVPPGLMPLQKKARQPYIFTADSVTSGLYAPAHRAPDLQGNYHALIRESTARETICCITLLPLLRDLYETIHHFGREKSAALKVGVNCRNS